MKKIVTLLFILSLIFSNISYSQVNVDYNYPLKVGKEFSYIRVSVYSGIPPPPIHDSSFVKYRIVSDTMINDKRYFKFDAYIFGMGTKLLRVDTLSGRLLMPSNVVCGNYDHESLVDSLRASFNDSVFYCYGFVDKCTDTGLVTIFGNLKTGRKFGCGFGGGSHWSYTEKRFAQQFGIYYYYSSGSGSMGSGYTRYNLKGCVINGIVYGDTVTYIGVKLISSEVPSSPSLSQNYPNPFNPVTKIKYQIPLSRGVSEGRGVLVKLIIYDVLGREIETLVNESQKPGSYEVTWDGSRYASGVYFYKLMTNDFIETKKMILIK